MNKIVKGYTEFLNESKATAKRRFLETDKIDKETFDKLVSIDPSSSFKYVEKMIEYHLEHKVDVEALEKQIKEFDKLSSRNLIKNKDIQRLSYEDFKKEIDQGSTKLETKEYQKEKEEGIQVILDNEYFRVVVPDTEEASCKYGQGTRWCTAATRSQNRFKEYRYRDDVTLYYILDKRKSKEDSLHQIAVAIYPNGNSNVFDATDYSMSFEEIPKELFKYIPANTFRPRNLSIELNQFEKFGIEKNNLKKLENGLYYYKGDLHLSKEVFDFLEKENIYLEAVEGTIKILNDDKLTNLKMLQHLKVAISFILEGCENLTSLEDLKQLTHIHKYLTIRHLNITNLKGLENLQQATYLNLGYNQLYTLEHLKSLTEVEDLSLPNNKLTNLKGLGKIKSLYTLNVQTNYLKDFKGFEKLEKLFMLYCSNNQIENFNGLEGLKNEKIFSISIIKNKLTILKFPSSIKIIENINLHKNPIISPKTKIEIQDIIHNYTGSGFNLKTGIEEFLKLTKEEQERALEKLKDWDPEAYNKTLKYINKINDKK